MGALNLEDIQGFILRGYRMPCVRHILLQVGQPAAARLLMGHLAGGSLEAPQITNATDWSSFKPDYCLNIGITWAGLQALQVTPARVPEMSFASFEAFKQGAAARAEVVGDTGPSDPRNWSGGFGSGRDHVILSLYGSGPAVLDDLSQRLAGLWTTNGAFEELWRHDGQAIPVIRNGQILPFSKVHFGYTDGIAQPTIEGAPDSNRPDSQWPCPNWLFVLSNDGLDYKPPSPPELGLNGSFGVFRLMRQDVVGFENFLQSHRDVIDPELLAAKLCGRWRNGVPLSLSPNTDSPSPEIPPDQWNNFEYVHQDGSGDPAGQRCPLGSHARRINPRGQPVKGQGIAGDNNPRHRILRRGMPYGPPYDPQIPYDGNDRGLLGYFINTRIEDQFEFLMKDWVNSAGFAGRTRLNPASLDVITGTNDPAGSIFEIPQPDGKPPLQIRGFSSFVTTLGGAYCFLPSITALRFIAGLG